MVDDTVACMRQEEEDVDTIRRRGGVCKAFTCHICRFTVGGCKSVAT